MTVFHYEFVAVTCYEKKCHDCVPLWFCGCDCDMLGDEML